MAITRKLRKNGTNRPEGTRDQKAKVHPLLDFDFDSMIDGRGLRAGEREKLAEILRSDNFRSCLDEAEVKCAVAVVALKLGVAEVLEVLRGELEKEDLLPLAKDCFQLVLEKFEQMQVSDSIPQRSRQLEILVMMGRSENPSERRAVEIVIEKADIKIGGICSW